MTRLSTVYGVDFAAARRDAHRKVWIARADAAPEGPTVRELRPAHDFFGGTPEGRDETLEALRRAIADSDGSAVWGLDFPFGVPAALIGGGADDDGADTGDGWKHAVTEFPSSLDLDGESASPDGLYERAGAVGEGGCHARRVDDDCDAQPAAGWFMRYLTYYGIARVIAPLVEDGGATVVPMQEPEAGKPVVMEVYPAGTLALGAADGSDVLDGAHASGYKGATDANHAARCDNLDALEGEGVTFDADGTGRTDFDLRERAAGNDDALDAVVAAVAAWRNLPDGSGGDAFVPTDYDPESDRAVEGYVYV